GARFVFMDKGWGALTIDELASLLEQLARMHARWAGDPRLDALAGYERPQRDFMKYCIRDGHWDEVLTRPFGHRLASIFPDATLAREAVERSWALNDASPKTLLHGDPHGGNVFFERDGTAGWMDFQLYFANSYTFDVSYLIQTGLSVENRRKDEGRMLRHYLEVAGAEGMVVDSFDDAWLKYRQQVVHTIVQGCCNPIEASSLEFLNSAGELITIAAEDLDVLGALGMAR
ncbi:MAG: phosphotransferase, partial [Novosphingobium sp.]